MATEDDVLRRLGRLENEQDKMEAILQQLVLSTQRMGDLLEQQKECLPKIENLQKEQFQIKIELSNSKLVQKGFIWLAGIIGSSAVTIAMAVMFGGK